MTKMTKNEMEEAEVLVVDLDQTLFLHTFWTRFFFTVSKLFHRLALKSEPLNKSLARDICNRKVIILTGRSLEGDKDILVRKLEKYNIKYDEIILCPRTEITMEWKKEKLEGIENKHGRYFWLDDMK